MTMRLLRMGAGSLVAGVMAGYGMPAAALSYDLYGFNVNWTQDVSIGATWRVENADKGLIGKTNLDDTLCIRDVDNNFRNNDQPGSIMGDACTTGDPAANQRYVDAPGAYSVNGDDGNLNYDQGDVVTAAGKLLSELSVSRGGWNLFVRGLAFFDEVNTDFLEFHPNDIFQPTRTRRPEASEDVAGHRAELLDVFISGGFLLPDFLGGNFVNIKAGDLVLNWGESTFLLPNSISATNPLDQARLRLPGFDIAELFSPIGIISASTSLTSNISAEVFYNYEWEAFTVDPPGSFFATNDVAGQTDRRYAMLSFGKAPEDPNAIYDPANNPQDTTGLVSSSSRTVYFADTIEPPDSGQYGIRMNYFADWIGAGTEFSFYFMNYHSRLPLVSAFAADATCIGETTTLLAQALLDCGGPQVSNVNEILAAALSGDVNAIMAAGGGSEGTSGRLQLGQEPLPVETVRLALTYPEDIKLYGFSWNTTLFDWAFSGEIAHRPKLPLQVNLTDVVFAALQPAFPRNNIVAADGAGGGENVIVPNRRAAVPDFIQNVQRNEAPQPNQFIPGFERLAHTKFDMTWLRTIGGSSWLGANRLLMIFELGFTHVDTPKLDQFQLSPAGIGTHISSGADGTEGRVDVFEATGPNNAASDACDRTCRQNPTSGTTAIDGLYDDFSTGYRFVMLPTYENVFWNVNLEPLFGWFHDFYGTTPGPAGSHVENRLQVFGGIRWDYLSSFGGEIRYTNFTNLGGTDQFIGNRDRDILSAFVRYQF